MSLSGQFGPNHFKREPRRREMKPTQGRQQILSTVAQRLSRSLLETGSIIAYSLSCCLDIAGIHIHLVEGKNTQNDTHVNMYAWWNGRGVHCSALPVNATLIFHRKGSLEEDMSHVWMLLFNRLLNSKHLTPLARSVYQTPSCQKINQIKIISPPSTCFPLGLQYT